MVLRIIARSADGKIAYAEEVTDVREVAANPMSLLSDPVQYTDRHGHVWNGERATFLDDLEGLEVVPVICPGVYRVQF